MSEDEIAEYTLKRGLQYPYDAPDAWWEGDGKTAPAPDDWAHAAVRGILADLNDRGGIKHGFANIDEEIRIEIVQSLARIVRAAHSKDTQP
jgi:hypothetical protein